MTSGDVRFPQHHCVLIKVVFQHQRLNNLILAATFLAFTCPFHFANASSSVLCSAPFTLFISAFAWLSHLLFSLSMSPTQCQVIGLSHSEGKWLAISWL
jgi:hypothetical protein